MMHLLTVVALVSLLLGCSGAEIGDSDSTLSIDRIEDSDGDGLSTSEEENTYNSDANDPNDPVPFGNLDLDRDTIPNGADADYSSDADDDGDGLSNQWEYSENLDPSEPEILLDEERFFSTVTGEYSWLKLTLKTPAGDPISGAAFSIRTDSPALLRAIYPAKGWVSSDEGVIEAPVIALGTGRSNLYLDSAEYPNSSIVLEDIDSTLAVSTHNPADQDRSFSSIKNNSAAGSGNARSMLQSSAAWIPQKKTPAEWIELPVTGGTRVAALLVQGRADAANWVSKIRISYEISPGLREFANNGAVFDANTDRNTLVRIPFDAPAGIARIRIHPVSWFLAPALRVALEVSDDNNTAAIHLDSDGDGFNDLLESRLGSDPSNANSPRLHNPEPQQRAFSSTEDDVAIGNDGADGRLYAQAWRSAAGDSSPWTELSIPEGSKLVGVALQGDDSTNRWISTLRYHDASVPALVVALQNGDIQRANDNANSTFNWWMPQNHGLQTLRLEPLTWSNGVGLRAALWVVDPTPSNDDNPHFSDSDGDGLNTLQERALGLDANNPDSDGDSFTDGQEVANGTDAMSADGDQDGLDDRVELLLGSDPLEASEPGIGNALDADDDGLSNAFELAVLNTNPDLADSDNDGLSDPEESQNTRTNPLVSDSDGDSLSDSEEAALASNPNLDSSPVIDANLDADDDGINAAREHQLGTDPEQRDSDGDGLLDGEEYSAGNNPLDDSDPVANGGNDSDGDGLSDAFEQINGHAADDADDPVAHGDADLDGDGIPNGRDPDYIASGDQDGDGLDNSAEYDAGSDPADGNSPQLGGAFDRDGDGTSNASDADFSLSAADDSDSDGISDSDEYSAGQNAIDAHIPLLGGSADIDGNSTVNNLDAGYDPLADEDSDSWNNAFEYRSGTDPTIANIAADFIDPVITLASAIGSPVQKYSLPDPGTNAPYYSESPALLASVDVVSSTPIEAARELHAGFASGDVDYLQVGVDAVIVNDTPRAFKNLGLRNSSSGTVTRVLGEIPPFSQSVLSAAVSNAEVIEPNPLSTVLLSEFQSLNNTDGSSRVADTSIDDAQRLTIANKLLLNHPSSWQSYNDYSNSACSSAICSSATEASDTLARLFYQQKPLAFAQLNNDSSYSRLSWSDKLALSTTAMAQHSKYQQARALSLAISATNGLLTGFADVLDSNGNYSLATATARGVIWSERGSYYRFISDAPNRRLTLTHFSARQLASIYVFSEDPGSELVSFEYNAATGEFELELTQAQWDTGRLALALEDRDGSALPSILLQWQASSSSWTGQPVSCENAAEAPCHD